MTTALPGSLKHDFQWRNFGLGKWVEQAAVEAGRPKTASGDGSGLLDFLAKAGLVSLVIVGLGYLISRLRRYA